MALSRSSANSSFLPVDTGALIVKPVTAISVATQTSTTIVTGAASIRIPIVNSDPQAAWVPELGEISPSDAVLGEVNVQFFKLAGLTIVSNELLADASPGSQPHRRRWAVERHQPEARCSMGGQRHDQRAVRIDVVGHQHRQCRRERLGVPHSGALDRMRARAEILAAGQTDL
jgi:hypothetical protein